ncbi:hypothetical protein J5U23_01757 [Saccharolobus shibatae B12]|uniref:Uncharacterized protein n=1 Tax=Saccharolobus shibatae (strain ATCC 51178 / DSM 5389 / JCM 8931 / NBRC 15437 / B12) TaxID=523848 RepID=A0A8F5GTF3_SACSH|nr:hypothetical protein J5U23_01757 [Saccharolobus shibatae B12]
MKIPYIDPCRFYKKRPFNTDDILRDGLEDVIKEAVNVFFNG